MKKINFPTIMTRVQAQLIDVRELYPNGSIVLGGGSFDLIHWGHVQYLHALKEYGDMVIVGVKSDAEIMKEKKDYSRPIIPETDRLKMVSAIKGVDYAFISPFSEKKPGNDWVNVIKFLQPDYFMTANPRWGYVKDMGITDVVIKPRYQGGYYASTTAIIERIADS